MNKLQFFLILGCMTSGLSAINEREFLKFLRQEPKFISFFQNQTKLQPVKMNSGSSYKLSEKYSLDQLIQVKIIDDSHEPFFNGVSLFSIQGSDYSALELTVRSNQQGPFILDHNRNLVSIFNPDVQSAVASYKIHKQVMDSYNCQNNNRVNLAMDDPEITSKLFYQVENQLQAIPETMTLDLFDSDVDNSFFGKNNIIQGFCHRDDSGRITAIKDNSFLYEACGVISGVYKDVINDKVKRLKLLSSVKEEIDQYVVECEDDWRSRQLDLDLMESKTANDVRSSVLEKELDALSYHNLRKISDLMGSLISYAGQEEKEKIQKDMDRLDIEPQQKRQIILSKYASNADKIAEINKKRVDYLNQQPIKDQRSWTEYLCGAYVYNNFVNHKAFNAYKNEVQQKQVGLAPLKKELEESLQKARETQTPTEFQKMFDRIAK